MEKNNDITQMICAYTEQIEKYESLSTWCAMLTVICILAVIFFAGSLMVKKSEKIDRSCEKYNLTLSALFLTIPSITTLYLYTFSMNMRKVALFRGFLAFLENQWNAMSRSEIMLFDTRIINTYFSPQSFLVNGLGPVVMILFLVIAAIVGYGASTYFASKLQNSNFQKGVKIIIWTVGIICVLFDGICCYYLMRNDATAKAVMEQCQMILLG